MTDTQAPIVDQTHGVRTVARWVLAIALAFAGINHFTNVAAFRAQVPPWMPWPEAVIAISGVIELALAVSLVALPRWRTRVGWIVAAFFVIVFPGNISQFITQTSAFGLDSDLSRGIRLLFQPVLVLWALWSTGAWRAWRANRARVQATAEQSEAGTATD